MGPKFAIAEFPNPAGDPDGKWVDAKIGAEYSTNEIPANKAATYNAKANINANMFSLKPTSLSIRGLPSSRRCPLLFQKARIA